MNTMEPDDTLQATEAVRPVLLAYIAGRLTPDQRDVFETRLLDDEGFSRVVEEAEFALVEDFASEALSPQERFDVEPWITASPQRSAQVAIAQTLRQRQRPKEWEQVSSWDRQSERGNVLPFVAHAPAPAPMMAARAAAPAPARAPQVISIASRRKAWYVLAPLAAAAALVAGVFVVRGHSPAGNETASNRPAQVQPATPETPGAPTAGGAANGLTESPDTLRLNAQALTGNANAAAEQIFHVHAGHPVELQIAVPPSVSGESFSLKLRAPGLPGLAEDHLRANTTDTPPVIDFTLPPNTLPPGHYSGELKSAAGSFPLQFRIER